MGCSRRLVVRLLGLRLRLRLWSLLILLVRLGQPLEDVRHVCHILRQAVKGSSEILQSNSEILNGVMVNVAHLC